MNNPLQNGDASADRIKADFVKKISQDISAPITDVVTTATQLLGSLLNAAQKEAVESIQYRGQSLLAYLEDTLELAKMDAGEFRLVSADFNLRDFIEETVASYSSQADAKSIELASLFYQDVPRQLRGDAGKLRQVLGAIIGNVIGYSRQGDVIIGVRRKSESTAGVLLHFSVRDTGTATSDDQQKFFRAFGGEGSAASGFDPSALRVSIIRKLAQLMGGEVGVESALGNGSSLWFTAHFEKQAADRSSAPVETVPSIPKAVEPAAPAIVPVSEPVEAPKVPEVPEAAAPAEEAPLEIPKFEDSCTPKVPVKAEENDAPIFENESVPVVPRFRKDQPAEGAAVPFYQNRPPVDEIVDTLSGGADPASSIPSIPKPPLLKMIMSKFPKQENGHGADGGKRRILVAEDNATNQKVILMKLQKMGYEAEVVSNGVEALDAVERASYDLILMDCTMPQMDGFEAATQIRVREGGNGKRIPIIAMAANMVENDRDKCTASGMDDTISKTAGPEDLQRIIGNWLPA